MARAVQDELKQQDLVGLVGRLRDALQGLANNPSDASAQQALSDSRNQLAALADAPRNGWPPTDRQILDEIGIVDVLGERLLERIEGILTPNDMTPSVALGEIQPIHDRLTEVQRHLGELLESLSLFTIGTDDVVDDYEVGVAIPRAAKSTLPELGREFVELQKIFGTFEELAGEGRPEFEVRALASSDFALFLLASPDTALIL